MIRPESFRAPGSFQSQRAADPEAIEQAGCYCSSKLRFPAKGTPYHAPESYDPEFLGVFARQRQIQSESLTIFLRRICDVRLLEAGGNLAPIPILTGYAQFEQLLQGP